MSLSGNRFDKNAENQSRFWRNIARAVVPVAKNLLDAFSAERNNADGHVIRGLGPIKWVPETQEYENQDDGTVILYFSSVDNQGHVENNTLDQIIFEGRTRRPLRDIQALVDRNLAGHLSWSVVNDNTELKAFVELSNWDGQTITIFTFDDDQSNDLMIRFNQQGSELEIENRTDLWRYQLNFIIVDSAGVTFQTDVILPALSRIQHVQLGDDFRSIVPIEKMYVSGTATRVEEPDN